MFSIDAWIASSLFKWDIRSCNITALQGGTSETALVRFLYRSACSFPFTGRAYDINDLCGILLFLL